MCKYCAEHGEGKKWYLSLKSHLKELVWDEELIQIVNDYLNVEAKTASPYFKELLRRLKSSDPRVAEQARREFEDERTIAQVIPLEDAKEIIRVASPIGRLACVCRRMFRANVDAKYCLGLGAFLDYIREWPDYTRGIDLLSKEEAIELVERWDWEGFVHTIWTAKTPFIIFMCQCEYPTCIGIRLRLDYQQSTFLKSEYIAQIDLNRCSGCKRCLSRCQFGAIRYSPVLGRCIVDMRKCFGCGICRAVCEENAINLTPRERNPVLRDVW